MSNRRPQKGPMGGGPAATRPAEKAKDFKGTFKKLMRYIRTYWFSLIVMLVFAVASTVFTIIGPKILGNATNKLVEGISQQMVYDKVTEQLPQGLTLPKGTTGADLMDLMPQEQKEKLSESQTEMLMDMSFDQRPSIDFSGIAYILLWLVGRYI